MMTKRGEARMAFVIALIVSYGFIVPPPPASSHPEFWRIATNLEIWLLGAATFVMLKAWRETPK